MTRLTAVGRDDLSLTAELLLPAVDPGDGGLLPHSRRRLRRALAASRGTGHGLPGAAWRARRAATDELARAGLVSKRGLRLTDPRRASARFGRVRTALYEPDAADARDLELPVLLAWCGVLGQRLTRDERRLAHRRVQDLLKSAEDGRWDVFGNEHPVPAWVGRLGGAAELLAEIDLFDSPELIDFGADRSGLR